MQPAIVILGVGNLLMSDDGVGPRAAQALAACPPAGTSVVDVGTDYLSALPWLESADRALIIDAVQGGGAPGAIYRLAERDLAPRPPGGAAHAVNLLDARRLLPPGAPWPEILILGVEPAVLDLGLTLSPPVAAALRQVLRLSHAIAAEWRKAGAAGWGGVETAVAIA